MQSVSAVQLVLQALVPQMKARRWGRIIHIASVMAFVSKEGRSVYSATKAALMGMTHAAALTDIHVADFAYAFRFAHRTSLSARFVINDWSTYQTAR